MACVSNGPCKEVIHKFKDKDYATPEATPSTLLNLPIQQCWPQDAGRFITLPCVVTQDPDSKDRNLGMYRMQVFDQRTTALHWQLQKVAARHGKRYFEEGRRMPVSVFLGGDPAYAFCASAPLPDGLDELLLAGWLRKKSVPLIKCETNDLEVPADADIVLEGYVDPAEPLRDEGPFGDHTGFYSLADLYPAFHITAVTMRREPIYPTTIVGKPPMEDFYMGKVTERVFLPLVRTLLPEVVDINMPAEGVFHNLVIVSLKKEYPGQARKVIHGLWGLGLMSLAKTIIAVDHFVVYRNPTQALA